MRVYLIGPDETLYDWHHEAPAWAFGQGRILHGPRVKGRNEETVLGMIRQGEGPSVEFKPYISNGDPKAGELVESAIAFANTGGGDILMGVNDHCVIEGIEHTVSEQAKKHQQTDEETLEIYIGSLRQVIAGAINRNVALEFEPVQGAGHTVLLVRVPEGTEKPYYRLRDNAVFVRRGANNVHADPDHDLPRLLQKPGLPF